MAYAVTGQLVLLDVKWDVISTVSVPDPLLRARVVSIAPGVEREMVSVPHVSMVNSLMAVSPDLVVTCMNPFVELMSPDISTDSVGVSVFVPERVNPVLANGVAQSFTALQNL